MIHFQLKKFQKRLITYSVSELISMVLFAVLLIIFITYIVVFFVVFNGDHLSRKIEDFSGFGSYLGGIGSIFSAFSLLFLIYSYRKDKAEQNYQKDETKLFRYYDYLLESKQHIQVKHKKKTYSNNDINEYFVSKIYKANVSVLHPETICSEKFIKEKNKLILFSSGYMPLYNLFLIISRFICEETIELNRKDSMEALLALLTNEEKMIVFFLLNNSMDTNTSVLRQIEVSSESNKALYNRCKCAHDYYFRNNYPET